MKKLNASYFSTANLRLWFLLILIGAVVCFSWEQGWFHHLGLSAAAQNVNIATTVSAASYAAIVAPEEIVAAFGVNLAPTTRLAEDADPSQPGVQLPTLLGGISVEVNGRSAGLFFVSPNQINFQVPPGLEPGTGYVIIRSDRGQVIAAGDIQITPAAPAIFTANGSGNGAPAGLAIRVKPNGQQLPPELLAVYDPAANRFVPRPIDLGAEATAFFWRSF